jgi:hypothetical protein
MLRPVLLVASVISACTPTTDTTSRGDSGHDGPAEPPGGGEGGAQGDTTTTTSSGLASGSGGQAGESVDVADAPPALGSTELLCKLINDEDIFAPTLNATHTRANLLGTDLGIPVAHGSDLYFFFGDTVGYQGIWPFSESVPDAVGYALDGRAAVAADPSTMCAGLRFLRLPSGSSLGPSLDPAIESDFAAASMTPPSGQDVSQYVKNPSGPPGQNAFPTLPGTFEVPSGAFSHDGAMYVLYTSVLSPQVLTMTASYLARWPSPSKTGLPSYQILHALDERSTPSGPLLGRFINVAAEPAGSFVYLFGTGDFRHSPVHLARKALANLDSPDGYEVFDSASGEWLAAPGASAAPLIADAKFGETSVRYFSDLGVWMFLAQGGHQVVARFAAKPEGPWSEEVTLHDNTDPTFLLKHCCAPEGVCSGEQLFNCSKAGFYGTYLLPDVAVDSRGFTVAYTLSTWDPYNVALFSARFELP